MKIRNPRCYLQLHRLEFIESIECVARRELNSAMSTANRNSKGTSCSGLRLKNTLAQGRPAFATFTVLKGVRAAQIVSHTGLDVSILGGKL